MLYVNVYGGVPTEPVNVITGGGLLFWHTIASPLIVAVDNGVTVTVAVCPVTNLLQFASLTEVSVYTKVPLGLVGTGTVTLDPVIVVTVWGVPLLILYVKV
jgi:hypothetical protein